MLPNFYVLGAQKAGTTWLAAMLRQHPQIFIPRAKELHFYNKERRFARGLAWYERQFAAAGAARAVGEATPNYLAVNTVKGRRVIERIYTTTPDTRFIVSLRNPGARAFSALLHAIRKRKVPLEADLDHEVEALIAGCADPWDVLAIGRYDVQLEAYFRAFGRERFQILIYEEDILERKRDCLSSVCHFLGVDDLPVFRNTGQYFNSGIRCRVGLALARLAPWGGVGPAIARAIEQTGFCREISLAPETQGLLDRYYLPVVNRLEQLLDRDLSCWRAPGLAAAESGEYSDSGALVG